MRQPPILNGRQIQIVTFDAAAGNTAAKATDQSPPAPYRRENEERHMALSKTYLATATLAVALMTAAASSADAGWVRSGSGTGPRGNSWSSTGSGSCAGGTCSSSQTFTGPRGTTTRNGSTTCSGGTCNHTGTITGPNGGTINRSSTVTYR
jgi:hypothetical protein